MSTDMFLKLDDIKGESQDKKHAGEIDVQAWSWGAAQMGASHGGGGSVHAVGKLKSDDWNGRNTVELEIEDLADPRSV